MYSTLGWRRDRQVDRLARRSIGECRMGRSWLGWVGAQRAVRRYILSSGSPSLRQVTPAAASSGQGGGDPGSTLRRGSAGRLAAQLRETSHATQQRPLIREGGRQASDVSEYAPEYGLRKAGRASGAARLEHSPPPSPLLSPLFCAPHIPVPVPANSSQPQVCVRLLAGWLLR